MRKPAVVFVFFALLVASLFLGDGKQPLVDVFFVPGIILGYLLVFYNKTGGRPPGPALIFWVMTIGYFFVRTIFSDSPGYSISATVRLTEAFLVYQLFYSLAEARTLRFFADGLRLVAVLAVAAAAFLVAFPVFAQKLPLMNLLYSNYGHNHLVDLLLFVFPLSLFRLKSNSGLAAKVMFLVIVLGIMASFARGAWVLVVGYVFFDLSRQGALKRPVKIIVLAAAATLFGWWLLSRPAAPAATSWLRRQLVKPLPWKDPRWAYWRQALATISERPLFGSGPGTFYLESRRLEDAPLTYSWFAHSFPLQTAAELGLVGAIPFFLLLFYHGKAFVERLKSKSGASELWNSLFWGLVLAFLYSWFEFNLDFLVVWLLFWATAGLLLGSIKETGEQAGRGWVTYLCLFVLALFYLSSLGSMVADSFLKNEDLALTLAPYNTDLALKYARSKPLPLWVMALHRHNSEVIAAQAEVQDSPDLYHEAIIWDRLNFDYRAGYLAALRRRGAWTKFTAALRDTSLAFLPEEARPQVDKINFNSALLISFYTPQTLEPLKNARLHQAAMAKLYYSLGLSVLREDHRLTEDLWVLASLTAPEWSYFHLELASLRKELGDLTGAQAALEVCQRQEPAKNHCRQFTVFSLPLVGSWTRQIQTIVP